MTTKCLIICRWLQLLLGFAILNFIKCDCPFPKEEIANGEYIYANPKDAKLINAIETYILFFNCSAGYELNEYSSIQCLDSEWSNEVPSCEAMPCDLPPKIANGTYRILSKDKAKVTIGDQAIYSCNPGYELSDPSVTNLACILNEYGDDTLWAGEMPVCEVMKPCSDPGLSMNGSREGDCCLPGSVLTYSCNEGFEMVGEKEIECLPSKTWTSPRPLCRPLEKHCELAPQIPNGVLLRKSGDYALANEETEIVCIPGYKFNGYNQFPYCNDSALWEDEFGECVEISCDPPEPLVNGNIPELETSKFNESFPYNFILTYDCKEGYRLKGNEPWRVCKPDGWTGKDPTCEEIFCPNPGAPKHGSMEGDSFKVGEKVRFKCFTGYELIGSFERYCRPNGQWTGELARCNAPTNYCPNPGIPINCITNGESYNKGDTVKFRCRPGFIQSGSAERTCQEDRTWSGTETKCLGPYDYDNIREIGNNLKTRLEEQFDEEIKEHKKMIAAKGLTGLEGRILPTSGRLLIYFAFDVSGSIGKTNFIKGVDFAKAIVNKIGVSENGARVGAMVFSTIPENIFFPMDYTTTQEVLDRLDAIEYTGGGTSATSALQEMINNIMLEERHFGKKDKKSVLFLITDGKANMGGSPDSEAETLKKMGVEIFCIGITGDVKMDALYKIASTSKYSNEDRPNVFMLKNYKSLSWLIQDITNGTLDYSQCGLGMESKMNSNMGKMVGGEVSVEPWPWMAALFFRNLKKPAAKAELKCGASIIKGNLILTAAHCMFEEVKMKNQANEHRKRSEEEIIVKLGLVDIRNETYVQDFGVETIYVHDDYVPGFLYDNDIAVLKLDRPVLYSSHIRPVCLPPAEFPEGSPFMKAKEFGWVAGWGHEKKVKPNQRNVQYKLSKHLKELRLQIQPNERCHSSLQEKGHNVNHFTKNMFCAGDGKSGNDTCRGDSGGPFMQPHMSPEGFVYWTQVGIVSWGIGCGNEGLYGYYTHLQRFLPWINNIINENR